MKHRIGAPTERHDDRHRVFKRFAGHDIARLQVEFQQIANGQCGPIAFVFLGWILRRNRGRIRQRHAQGFDGRSHGVGRVHAPASPCSRTGVSHDALAGLVVDLTCEILTIALECRDNVQRMSIPLASSNRSAVNHQRRTIQSPHRNQTPWHVLVTTRDGDQSIVPLATHDRFDRIGNQIPGLKRE